jgi:hypothetical protein
MLNLISLMLFAIILYQNFKRQSQLSATIIPMAMWYFIANSMIAFSQLSPNLYLNLETAASKSPYLETVISVSVMVFVSICLSVIGYNNKWQPFNAILLALLELEIAISYIGYTGDPESLLPLNPLTTSALMITYIILNGVMMQAERLTVKFEMLQFMKNGGYNKLREIMKTRNRR